MVVIASATDSSFIKIFFDIYFSSNTLLMMLSRSSIPVDLVLHSHVRMNNLSESLLHSTYVYRFHGAFFPDND